MPVLTKSQLKKLYQEELLDYAEKVGNIEKLEKSVTDLSRKFGNITNEFKKVSEEFKKTKEELLQIRAENLDIMARLTKMEIVTNNVAQYSRRECLELHEVPNSIGDQDLGEKVVQLFSLTGVPINQDDIMQCHRLKKKTYVIVKLKERQMRYNMVNRSKLKGKNDHLKRIGFKDAVFINKSMSPGYKYLHYLCRRLLRDRQIHSYWFFNYQLKIKLEERCDVNIIEQHIDNFVKLGLLVDQYMV